MELTTLIFGKAFARGLDDLGYVNQYSKSFLYSFGNTSLTSVSFPKLTPIDENATYEFYIEITVKNKRWSACSKFMNVFVNKIGNDFIVVVKGNDEETLNKFIDYIRVKYPDLQYKRDKEFNATYKIPYETALNIYTSTKLEGIQYD